MSKEEIMVLDAEQIEARKAELKVELEAAENDEAMDAIKAENDLLEERKAQIKLEVEQRKADMAAVIKGQEVTIYRWCWYTGTNLRAVIAAAYMITEKWGGHR